MSNITSQHASLVPEVEILVYFAMTNFNPIRELWEVKF